MATKTLAEIQAEVSATMAERYLALMPLAKSDPAAFAKGLADIQTAISTQARERYDADIKAQAERADKQKAELDKVRARLTELATVLGKQVASAIMRLDGVNGFTVSIRVEEQPATDGQPAVRGLSAPVVTLGGVGQRKARGKGTGTRETGRVSATKGTHSYGPFSWNGLNDAVAASDTTLSQYAGKKASSAVIKARLEKAGYTVTAS